MLGLTVLYLPFEGKDFSIEEASANKDLAKRLELVLSYWLNQMKIAITDKEQLSTNELLCVKDEYDFWAYRRKCRLKVFFNSIFFKAQKKL